jgi:hypothetical protein
MLHILAGIGGAALLLIALADAFDTIVLARRAERIFRITGLFYRISWGAFAFFARRMQSGERRERYLSVYGPLSLLVLLALWGLSVVCAFALLHWAASLRVKEGGGGFGYALYFSAGALITMTVGEPLNHASRAFMVIEAGLGYSLLGLVVGYLPTLYQSFANREEKISRLDARAGSPPAASELIRRQGMRPGALQQQLASWEDWASNLLETQLSYPMLAYFRSPTRKPIVAQRAHDGDGCQRVDSSVLGCGRRTPGGIDFRHGPPRHGRPGNRVPFVASAAPNGSPARF